MVRCYQKGQFRTGNALKCLNFKLYVSLSSLPSGDNCRAGPARYIHGGSGERKMRHRAAETAGLHSADGSLPHVV
jgi:hypothetical protein